MFCAARIIMHLHFVEHHQQFAGGEWKLIKNMNILGLNIVSDTAFPQVRRVSACTHPSTQCSTRSMAVYDSVFFCSV